MSDDERGRGGGADDDVSLPKATVAKLVQGKSIDRTTTSTSQTRLLTISHIVHPSELLPPNFSCSKEAKDLMTECCKGEPSAHLADGHHPAALIRCQPNTIPQSSS